jgi:hypothetical protein
MDAGNQIISLANECWASRCLHTVVALKIADLIGDGSRDVDEISAEAGVDARYLQAILRVLSDRGIFSVKLKSISHTEASRLLASDHPNSLAQMIEWIGSCESWSSLGHLAEATKTGISGFELAFGGHLFDYLASNQSRMAIFGGSMESFARREVGPILASLDLSKYDHICDVGAGTGLLARTIASRYPSKNVVAFDLPGVRFDNLPGLSNVEVVHGSFFDNALPKTELAILMNVLHDWSDDDAARILSAVSLSLGETGHLCIVEGFLSEGTSRQDMINLGMLVMTGGWQRTKQEYAVLLERCGYEIFCDVRCSDYHSAIIAARAYG